MKHKIFISAVTLFLSAFMLYSPVVGVLERKGILNNMSAGIEVERPEAATGIAAPVINSFYKVKADVESVYSNYFPFYTNVVSKYKQIQRKADAPVFWIYDIMNCLVCGGDLSKIHPYGDPAYSAEFLGQLGSERIYKITAEYKNGDVVSFLEVANTFTADEKKRRVETQAENINRLANANKNVNFYVYAGATLEFSDIFTQCVPDEVSCQKDLQSLFSKLDPRIKTLSLEINDISDRMDFFYRTDHHWAPNGMYRAYSDIYDEVYGQDPDESAPPKYAPVNSIVLPNCKFYGSFSRRLAYESMYDGFTVNDYGLPMHTTDPLVTLEDQIKETENINSINSNAYGTFFREIYTVRYPKNKTGHNLLVIGDSYAQGISELLASAFDNTYIFYWGNYRSLDYNKFIAENDITDVMIVQYAPRLVFNNTNDYFLDRINITPYEAGEVSG